MISYRNESAEQHKVYSSMATPQCSPAWFLASLKISMEGSAVLIKKIAGLHNEMET